MIRACIIADDRVWLPARVLILPTSRSFWGANIWSLRVHMSMNVRATAWRMAVTMSVKPRRTGKSQRGCLTFQERPHLEKQAGR